MINPTMLFQMKNMKDRFEKNHPKFPQFLKIVAGQYIESGTILEIKVTKADGQKIESNIRLNDEDMQLIETIRQMSAQ